jgi:hypothetical protein
MKHSNQQQRFFSDVIGSEHFDDNRSLYQDLIYDQFEDTILSAFPLFTQNIDKLELRTHIKDFIKYGSKSPYIWKMTSEFASFMLHRLSSKRLKEQLLFDDWQIKLYMHPHTMRQTTRKSNRRTLALSKTATSLKLGNDYFVIYKNRFDNEVYILKITKILSIFLKLLRNRYHTSKAVRLVSMRVNIPCSKLLPLLTQAQDDLYAKGIIE